MTSPRWLTPTLLFALAVCVLTPSARARDESPISGLFKVNGQEAKLAFVSVTRDKAKDRLIVIVSEKDPSKEKDPEMALQFDRLGSGIAIKAKPDGSITSCQVNHTAMKGRGGFNSVGEIALTDLKIADGKIQGKLSTGGQQKAFDEVWEVNLKFHTKAP